jgi:hypothetical protein
LRAIWSRITCTLPWLTVDWKAPSRLCAKTPSSMACGEPFRSCAAGPRIWLIASVERTPCSGAQTFSAEP